MFFKKKPISQIDDDQIALVENAQRRIRQKKGYTIILFFGYSPL